jgi:hypothetical protein
MSYNYSSGIEIPIDERAEALRKLKYAKQYGIKCDQYRHIWSMNNNRFCLLCGKTRLEIEEENAEATKQYLERREKEKKLEDEQLKKNQEKRSFWHK